MHDWCKIFCARTHAMFQSTNYTCQVSFTYTDPYSIRRELAFSEKDPVTPISYWSTCHHAHTSCVISYLHTMRKREGRTNPSSHFVNIRFPRPTEHIICPAVGFSFIGYTLDVPFPMSKGRAATGHPRDPETIGRLASVVNQSQVSQTPDHNNTRYSGIDE